MPAPFHSILIACLRTYPRRLCASGVIVLSLFVSTMSFSFLAAPAALAVTDRECIGTLEGLTTRQKLAQLLMVGVTGTEELRSLLQRELIGGIIIASNTSHSLLTSGQLRALSASSPVPLLVSIDEEGGRVSRVPDLIGRSPSARELAATRSPEQVRAFAADRARALHALGITANFAPVVDTFSGNANTVIGDRSFSGDPATVTRYAEEYAAGMREGGILPVIKHFPGHGRASGDSHRGSVVTPPLADLRDVDLVPFRELIRHDGSLNAVMVGHLLVPGLTESSVPTSLSPATYRLLREGAGYGSPGFDGLVFTDDLSSMRAVSENYDVPHAVAQALKAGADVALWMSSFQVPAVLSLLEQEVASGALPLSQVERSVQRVFAAKGISPHTCSPRSEDPSEPSPPEEDSPETVDPEQDSITSGNDPTVPPEEDEAMDDPEADDE